MKDEFDSREAGLSDSFGRSVNNSGRSSRLEADQEAHSARLVKRPALQQSISSALDRDSLAVICSEPGMGVHTASRFVAASYEATGLRVAWAKLNVKSEAAVCRRINKAVAQLMELAHGPGSGSSGLLVVDGFDFEDENYAIRASKYVIGAILAGVHVLVLMSPDYSHLIDYFPNCRIIGTRDLVLPGSEIRKWCGKRSGRSIESIRTLTHGIPALVDVFRGNTASAGSSLYPSEWDNRATELYMTALRPKLISEEWLIRFGMCAFGSGHVDDLRACGIRVSSDIAYELAQGCPLLGFKLETGCFECVPLSESSLCHVLNEAQGVMPSGNEVLPEIVAMLINQGKYRRAGTLASLCLESSLVVRRILDYPLELIDAGYLGLVASVANGDETPRSAVARSILDVLGVPVSTTETTRVDLDSSQFCTRKARLQVRLFELCRDMESSASLNEVSSVLARLEPEVSRLDDALSSKVYHHARSLLLAMSGAALEAFRELVLAQDLREQPEEGRSLFSALLCRDFEALGKIVGSPESQRDASAFRAASELMLESGVAGLAEQVQAICELSGIVAGERKDVENANRAFTRWRLAQKSRLVMWGSAVLSLGDSLRGQFQHAHVRALEAIRISDELNEGDALALSRMAERCALRGLGERDSLDAVRAEILCSPDIAALDRLHESLGSDAVENCDDELLDMRTVSPRNGVMALAVLVSSADRSCGPRMTEQLPLSWKGGLASRGLSPSSISHQRQPALPSNGRDARLNVCVLGGVTAWKNGVRIPERDWTRRQAKMLLALLALAPGHLIQRHEAISLLWPDTDLARGRESLYTVLSSLRTTLGQTAGSNRFVLGELGQIWLDGELVSCDIDEFEEIARRVVSRKVEDGEAIALCVALEGMYNGGSFVPTNDSVGRFRDRHEELARRYRDAMLVGVEAATRLRDTRQAAWFAQSAKRIG